MFLPLHISICYIYKFKLNLFSSYCLVYKRMFCHSYKHLKYISVINIPINLLIWTKKKYFAFYVYNMCSLKWTKKKKKKEKKDLPCLKKQTTTKKQIKKPKNSPLKVRSWSFILFSCVSIRSFSSVACWNKRFILLFFFTLYKIIYYDTYNIWFFKIPKCKYQGNIINLFRPIYLYITLT